MYQNEPNASLRQIPARLLDNTGAPLPLNHAFGVNDLKIIQPDGTITNASALPTPVAGAAAGTFTVQVAQAELQQLGNVRWELTGSGVTYWEWAETVVMQPAQAAVVVTAAQLVQGQRYSLVAGNLEPDMVLTLVSPGAIAALPTAQAVNMLWTKPDGTTSTVPLVVVTPGNGTSGAVVKRVWSAGDTLLPGLHKGTVMVTDASGKLVSDPVDGTHVLWWVYATPDVGTVVPGTPYTNGTASTFFAATPVYQVSASVAGLAEAVDVTHATCVGLVMLATGSGATGRVLANGLLALDTAQWDVVCGTSGGLTPNAAYYLSDATPGRLTSAPPTQVGSYVTFVGVATSSTQLSVDVRAPAGPIVDNTLGPLFFKMRSDSNGVGQGTVDHLDRGPGLAALNPVVLEAKVYATSTADPPTLITYGPAQVGPYQPTTSLPGMGVQLSLARELAAVGAKPYLASYGINGTTAADWAPTSVYPSTGGNLDARASAFFATQKLSSGRSKTAATCIILGTNDASTVPLANAYQANLTAIIADERAVEGSALIIAQPKVNIHCTNPQLATVRAAQVAYAVTDPNFLLIDNDDLSLGAGDGFHYSSDEYVTLGQRIAYATSDKLGYARPKVTTPYPQVVGYDVAQYGSGQLVQRSWAGQVNNDLEILIVSTGLLAAAISLASAQGYTLVNSVNSLFSGLQEQLAVFQRPVQSSSFVNGTYMPSPTIADTNDQNASLSFTVRGDGIHVPVIEASQPAANNTDGTTMSMAGVTTLGANRLILCIGAGFVGGANTVSVANGTTALAKVWDGLYNISGNFQIVSLSTGVLAAQGASGTTTLTSTAAAIHTGMTLAIKTS